MAKDKTIVAAWIGGGATIVAALIGAVFFYLGQPQDNQQFKTTEKYAAISVGYEILVWSSIQRASGGKTPEEHKDTLLVAESRIQHHLLILGIDLEFPPSPPPSFEELQYVFLKYDRQLSAKLKRYDEEMYNVYFFGLVAGTLLLSVATDESVESRQNLENRTRILSMFDELVSIGEKIHIERTTIRSMQKLREQVRRNYDTIDPPDMMNELNSVYDRARKQYSSYN